MGTRAFITVVGLESVGLYRHNDGYPGGPHGVLASLGPFVAKFKEQRGNDPQYFMARLVCDQIAATGSTERMTGFGILGTSDPSNVDCALHYQVDLETGEITVKEMK